MRAYRYGDNHSGNPSKCKIIVSSIPAATPVALFKAAHRVSLLLLIGCATDRTLISKSGFREGWQDDTRYVVIGIAGHTYAGLPAKYAVAQACREAKDKIPRRFSEELAGADDGQRCGRAESTGDPFCNWNLRLDEKIFNFPGKEIHRRHDFRRDAAICEIVMEYSAPDLKKRAETYRARFELAVKPPS